MGWAEIETISAKLRTVRGRQSQSAIARTAGIAQASLSQFERAVHEPAAGTLARLAVALNVSIDYLAGLTDHPAPAATLAAELAHERAKVRELEDAGALAPADSREFRPVVLTQGTGIAAGAGANAADERVLGSLAFRNDWLRRHGLNTAQCRVIEVIGDSMEPTLEHRAVILVDFQRTIRRRDKIFAVRTEDGPVVKRLQRTEDGWQLVSDNRAYKPVPWPREAVVIGQVMWTGRTL